MSAALAWAAVVAIWAAVLLWWAGVVLVLGALGDLAQQLRRIADAAHSFAPQNGQKITGAFSAPRRPQS